MDEVAVGDLAGGAKELDSGGDVEVDDLEPGDLRGSDTARRAVDDRGRVEVERGLGEAADLRHIDLLLADVGVVAKQVRIGPAE